MGLWDFYDIILKWFETAHDNFWLHAAAVAAVMLTLGLLIGGGLYLALKAGDTPSAPDPERVFIEENALAYCKNLSFESWRWKENSSANQFECFTPEPDDKKIEKFLNMS